MTGRYRTWPVAKWDRDPFRSLPPMQRYLYLTLHQGPYSTAVPGVSVCGPAALAEAAGDVPDFHEHLAAMEQAGVLRREGRLFILPDVLADAVPTNPNGVRAWRAGFTELPDGPLKDQIDHTIRQVLITYGEAHPVRFQDHRSPDPFAYIRAWDPTFDQRSANVEPTLPERSAKVAERFPEGSLNRSPTLAEPVTGTGTGSEAGSGSEAGPGPGAGVGEGWGVGKGEPGSQRLRERTGFTSVRSLAGDPDLQRRIARAAGGRA